MKNFLLLTALVFSVAAFAQVGIGTTTPNSSLDIPATNPIAPSHSDGILIPRINAFPLINPAAAQNGMMVFFTVDLPLKPKGFYYWDNSTSSWIGISGTKGWDLAGNSGTSAATNFIGTTDDNNLIFKRNNILSGKLSNAATSFGVGALNPVSSGVYNTAIGAAAMQSNTSGHSNTTVGSYAMFTNIDGVRNTAIGTNSMYYNQNGQKNTALGNNALNANTTGSTNTAVGNDALSTNQIGINNTAIGNESGSLISGSGNLTIGANTNVINPAGNHQMNIGQVIFGEGINMTQFAKVGIGETAPKAKLHMGSAANPSLPTNADGIIISCVNNLCAPASMTADQNGMMVFLTTAVGANNVGFYYWDNPAGAWKGVGTNTANAWGICGNPGTNPATNFVGTTDDVDVVFKRNNMISGQLRNLTTSFGLNALEVNTGYNNVAFGGSALKANTIGVNNAAFGLFALAANTIGGSNFAIGYNAMGSNTTAGSNVAIGANSLSGQNFSNGGVYYDTNNIGIGIAALAQNNPTAASNGIKNVAIGNLALANNATGTDNIGIGFQALLGGTTGSGSYNVAIGTDALSSNASGNSNIGVGALALDANIHASNNVAIGKSALNQLSFSNGGLAFDTYNVAIGNNALLATNPTSNTNGQYNTAIGHNAAQSNRIGSSNVAIGPNSLFWNHNGNNNVAVGNEALFGSSLTGSTGSGNVGFGYRSLGNNTNGNNNLALGTFAMAGNDTGSNNVVIGQNAMVQSARGDNATAIGTSAMYYYRAGSITSFTNTNTVLGYQAMLSEHFGAVPGTNNTGLNNTVMGYNSLQANSTGSNNTLSGYQSMYANKIGNSNTAIGQESLYNSVAGSNGTAIGFEAMYNANNIGSAYTNQSVAIGYQALKGSIVPANNTGNNNTALGYQTLLVNSSGYFNTAIGNQALMANSGGSSNTAVGNDALKGITLGADNVALGRNAGLNQVTGSNNTMIGNYVYPTSGNAVNNYTGIGYNVGGGASLSNMVELGNGSVTAIRAQVTGITAYSDRRIKNNIEENVPGLDFINKLRPVTYNLDLHKQNEIIYRNKKEGDKDWEGKYDIEKIKQTGFIAQEVATAAAAVNYDFNGVSVPENAQDLYSVNYTSFVVPLVKAVQEQQQIIEKQQEKLDMLEERLRAIESRLDK